MFQHLKKKQKIGQTLQYSHLILKKKWECWDWFENYYSKYFTRK
jgi:hypothetical protein